MINSVVLVGRLVRDPELRRTTNGAAVASFTVAVDNQVKDANGNRTASFIPCTVWNVAAENVTKYAHKGSLVGVTGRLNQRSYENKDGKTVNVVEVICERVQFLEPKGNGSAKQVDESRHFEAESENNSDEVVDLGMANDDLPF